MAQRSTGPDLDLADLDHLSRSRLRDLWEKELREKPPQSFGRELLALGIAYDRQERRYGGMRKASARRNDRGHAHHGTAVAQKSLAFLDTSEF
jgi:hypothetical protein